MDDSPNLKYRNTSVLEASPQSSPAQTLPIGPFLHQELYW